ncbi:hypothetical protein F0310_03060 [Borrelia sp. A-FGy1]|uniref:hypothetical protein n=1 Tax=Borrelia sp. A-FGy1 TaxID=2608247 RepID=UPI0015F3CA65|nr:hypothetical protein [Borrelia sp. A-FGy1]QMU99377.1 hypothetical protein F0310_03060 [Borrelia sp. A-FGy1]
MLKSHFFVKKCKKAISQDEIFINNARVVQSVFYDFLKIFNRKSLENIFSYYYGNFDSEEGIYAFIDKFLPIIRFLSLESLDCKFNLHEKKLILDLFDSSAGNLESSKLNELASAIVSLGILS